jgi:hypothetical protein
VALRGEEKRPAATAVAPGGAGGLPCRNLMRSSLLGRQQMRRHRGPEECGAVAARAHGDRKREGVLGALRVRQRGGGGVKGQQQRTGGGCALQIAAHE